MITVGTRNTLVAKHAAPASKRNSQRKSAIAISKPRARAKWSIHNGKLECKYMIE